MGRGIKMITYNYIHIGGLMNDFLTDKPYATGISVYTSPGSDEYIKLASIFKRKETKKQWN